MFTFLTLLVIYSGVIVGYKIFEPENAEEIADSAMTSSSLDYDTLKDYTLNSGASAIHYYFFGSSKTNDSLYVMNTVLRSVNRDTSVDLSTLIEYVDISSLEDTGTTQRLKDDWTVSTYPAFVACQVQDGQIVILNKLEWNANSPMSEDNIIQWLVENGLYDGSTPDLIATPSA
jgi:hypothetical protein